MSTKLAAERQKLMAKINAGQSNGQSNGQNACISKSLYEQPPQSNWFLIQLFYNISHLYLTYMSKIVIGQFIISSFDYYMTKFEKTLDFCISKDDIDDVAHNRPKTAKDTKHPMIWFLFLPALIGLRFVFFWASVFSIVLGKGEVTAKEVQLKVSEFRRYYRSVRYYAVKQLSEEEFKEREAKTKHSVFWRFIYFIDELIFMRKYPVFCDDEMHEKHIAPGDQTDNRFRLRNGRNIKKSSLNEIDGDSSDEGLNTIEKLDKYSKLKDSPSVDPDYKPGDDPSSEDVTSDGEVDSEEEKTESQKKLNGDENGHQSTKGSVSGNGFSSDVDARQKSKKESGLSLDQQQLADLENQLVMKIMKHFKTNYNYSPGSGANVDDVFYSPIGSPPEKGYISDSEVPTINNDDGSSNNMQNPEVSSSQENSERAEKSQENNQV